MRGFAISQRVLGILALCAWTVGPAYAQNDLEASVALLEIHLEDAGDTKTTQYVNEIGDKLAGKETYATMSRADALKILRESVGTSVAEVAPDVVNAVRSSLQEGEDLAFTKPKRAIGVLTKVRSQIEGFGDSMSGHSALWKDYFKTLILLARCQLFSGDEKTARTTLQVLHRRFGTEYPVTTEDYHPKLVELYERVGKQQASERTGTLTVRTQPAGCQVYVNGRLMTDEAPARYTNLYPGKATVMAVKGALRSTTKSVMIPDGSDAEVDIDLAYESALVFHDGKLGLRFSDEAALKKNLINYSVTVGKLLQVDYVVLSGVIQRSEQPFLAVWQVDVKSRAIVKERALTVKSNVVSNRRVEEITDYIASADVTPVSAGPRLKPWYTNWIGWTLVGSGVALSAVAGGLGYQYAQYRNEAQARYPDGLTPQEQDAEFAARLDAKQNAEGLEVPMYVLGGLAGASIIAGIVVFVMMDVEEEQTSKSTFRFGRDIVASPMLLRGGGGVTTQIRF